MEEEPLDSSEPLEPNNSDLSSDKDKTLRVTQPGERTICEIRRHPIGIFNIYVTVGLLLIIAAVLAFVVIPHIFANSYSNNNSVMAIADIVFLFITLVGLTFTFISTKVYWGTFWILTSDSVTQVSQISLFNQRSTQFSLDDLEEVSSEQDGFLTHIFNYGKLKAETAGDRTKFVFMYCPNPNYYAKQILSAREKLEQSSRAGNVQHQTGLSDDDQ